MQEEVESRSVHLAISGTKLTGRMIMNGMRAYLRHRESVKRGKAITKQTDIKHGQQTVKELIGQNQGVSSIPLNDDRIKDFTRIAKKYGVDFAVTKDKGASPPRYTVFFKARDADALTSVMAEYTDRVMNKEKRPSVLKQLNKFKALVASLPKKVRQKEKEQVL